MFGSFKPLKQVMHNSKIISSEKYHTQDGTPIHTVVLEIKGKIPSSK